MNFKKLTCLLILTTSLASFILSMQEEDREKMRQEYLKAAETSPLLLRLPKKDLEELINSRIKKEEDKKNNDSKTT